MSSGREAASEAAYHELEKFMPRRQRSCAAGKSGSRPNGSEDSPVPTPPAKGLLRAARSELARQIESGWTRWEESVKDNRDKLTTFLPRSTQLPLADAVKTIRDLVNKQFRSRLSEVFVAQTRIRVFLIELKPVNLTVDQAIQIALANRLDLKNALAAVTDAWRNVEVDANALRGFVNFIYNGNLALGSQS